MNFYQKVYQVVKKIPSGKVATYGQIGSIISSPRSAQIVGFALRALPENSGVPWQRVINSEGRISIQNLRHRQSEQADLLKKEGVEVEFRDNAYCVDLAKYLHRFKRFG
ncbi:MAG: MGMT family protein [Candidatus Sungbacteria bacterium]|uniref:MGMT family protein n=1 Tax=Candidatus Sungiibacteriota bacterium TaxID=2750080 RepID=A0A9D6LPY8_9BACT|nr:MGMT family protein [Candidatus Sungbacteria bacterium]